MSSTGHACFGALFLRLATGVAATVGCMRSLLLAVAAAALMSACATGTRATRAPEQGGHATQQGAAFMGYHGPVWRANTPAD